MPVSDLGVVICIFCRHPVLWLEAKQQDVAQVGVWIVYWLFGAHLEDEHG